MTDQLVWKYVRRTGWRFWAVGSLSKKYWREVINWITLLGLLDLDWRGLQWFYLIYQIFGFSGQAMSGLPLRWLLNEFFFLFFFPFSPNYSFLVVILAIDVLIKVISLSFAKKSIAYPFFYNFYYLRICGLLWLSIWFRAIYAVFAGPAGDQIQAILQGIIMFFIYEKLIAL